MPEGRCGLGAQDLLCISVLRARGATFLPICESVALHAQDANCRMLLRRHGGAGSALPCPAASIAETDLVSSSHAETPPDYCILG